MADDRLPRCRWESTVATKSDNVMWRSPPISFRLFQNASSRLTLVLWPATTTDRLVTRYFITTRLLLVENSQHPNTKFVPFCGRLKESRSVAKITLAEQRDELAPLRSIVSGAPRGGQSIREQSRSNVRKKEPRQAGPPVGGVSSISAG